MISQRARVWLRVSFVVVATPAAFFSLQSSIRPAELHLYVEVLDLLGLHWAPQVFSSYALVVPLHSSPILVDMTPSCSALASVLTLGCLASVLPRQLVAPRSRLLAFLAATACVFLGNLLRIDLSIGAGVLFGRSALVLFHDWVGSIFGFAYTLGGFGVMLMLLLPPRAGARSRGRALRRLDGILRRSAPVGAISARGASPAASLSSPGAFGASS